LVVGLAMEMLALLKRRRIGVETDYVSEWAPQ
jgi:hypothetical protein